ncbi:hypothetical protein R9X47_28105 [Wukongibacter baidiensis]|uniref:hypothetical protein n=1 Tax=Wukongibacter baidiensis TaxID=1723361 RepID=UPI003D7F2D54
MNLEHVCINKMECGEETIFLARVKRGDTEAEVRITEETASFLNVILCVPYCEDGICKELM